MGQEIDRKNVRDNIEDPATFPPLPSLPVSPLTIEDGTESRPSFIGPYRRSTDEGDVELCQPNRKLGDFGNQQENVPSRYQEDTTTAQEGIVDPNEYIIRSHNSGPQMPSVSGFIPLSNKEYEAAAWWASTPIQSPEIESTKEETTNENLHDPSEGKICIVGELERWEQPSQLEVDSTKEEDSTDENAHDPLKEKIRIVGELEGSERPYQLEEATKSLQEPYQMETFLDEGDSYDHPTRQHPESLARSAGTESNLPGQQAVAAEDGIVSETKESSLAQEKKGLLFLFCVVLGSFITLFLISGVVGGIIGAKYFGIGSDGSDGSQSEFRPPARGQGPFELSTNPPTSTFSIELSTNPPTTTPSIDLITNLPSSTPSIELSSSPPTSSPSIELSLSPPTYTSSIDLRPSPTTYTPAIVNIMANPTIRHPAETAGPAGGTVGPSITRTSPTSRPTVAFSPPARTVITSQPSLPLRGSSVQPLTTSTTTPSPSSPVPTPTTSSSSIALTSKTTLSNSHPQESSSSPSLARETLTLEPVGNATNSNVSITPAVTSSDPPPIVNLTSQPSQAGGLNLIPSEDPVTTKISAISTSSPTEHPSQVLFTWTETGTESSVTASVEPTGTSADACGDDSGASVNCPFRSSSPGATTPDAATKTAPSVSSPTSPPSNDAIKNLELFETIASISSDGGDSILVVGSPQHLAFKWLEGDVGTRRLLRRLQNTEIQSIVQRYALAVFFYSTGGENWIRRDGWLSSTDECLWYTSGVSCNQNGRFTELSFEMNNQTGELPPQLALLATLTKIDIVSDPGSGGFIGGIPKELESLSFLDSIRLTGNSFTEPLPPRLFRGLRRVTTIDLTNSGIPGRLPPSIGDMPHLIALYLGENRFEGKISEKLGKLESLVELVLQGNQLRGHIPVSIGQMISLTGVILADNELEGPIPSPLGNLVSLTTIDLSNNDLTGSLPAELGNLTNLRRLLLQKNQLSGTLPTQLELLSKLQLVRLDSNDIFGAVSNEACNSWISVFADCTELICPCCTYCCNEGNECE